MRWRSRMTERRATAEAVRPSASACRSSSSRRTSVQRKVTKSSARWRFMDIAPAAREGAPVQILGFHRRLPADAAARLRGRTRAMGIRRHNATQRKSPASASGSRDAFPLHTQNFDSFATNATQRQTFLDECRRGVLAGFDPLWPDLNFTVAGFERS